MRCMRAAGLNRRSRWIAPVCPFSQWSVMDVWASLWKPTLALAAETANFSRWIVVLILAFYTFRQRNGGAGTGE